MDRSDVEWWGYWPAAPTPFTGHGDLDEDAWRALVGLYIGQGVHGLLVNGSTGEWFSQSPPERRRVAEVAVEEVNHRIPVVIGVSAYTPHEAGALARHAEDVGADGILATPPPYVHPSPDEIVAFYREVSESSGLPLMVYNWPRGVGVDIGRHAGLFRRLADLEPVVAIKDSTGDWASMVATVEELCSYVRIFGSFLHRPGLAVLLGLGGDGNIDGGGLAAPYGVRYYEAVRARDRARAEWFADQYVALTSRFIGPNYSGIYASPVSQLKAAMRILGQPGGTVRAPLLELTDPNALADIERLLDASGLRGQFAADRLTSK